MAGPFRVTMIFGDSEVFTEHCCIPSTLCDWIASATDAEIIECLENIDRYDDICPGGGGSVDILDQNDNIIDTVTCGGTYQVFVLDGINDATPYEDYVINDN
jgi:hypothetical protein